MLSLLNGKECLKLPLHTLVSLSQHRCVLKTFTHVLHHAAFAILLHVSKASFSAHRGFIVYILLCS